jgi:replicative DNA helicase
MAALQSTTSTEMVTGRLQSLHSFLEETNDRLKAGQVAGAKVWPSGFGALDKALTGGFRSGELVLLGGPQGLGKTTFALQVMRNLIASNHRAVYFSFEHDNHTLLERLIAMEAAEIAGPTAVPLHRVRRAFEARHSSEQTLEGRLGGTLGGVEAVQALQGYARRLHLYRSNGSDTDVEAMRRVIETIRVETREEPFVVVDYLQKVHVPGSGGLSEDERVTVVVEALKDLALELSLPVVAIVAADKSGLATGKRMRVHDLRGSSALAYEPDIVLIINDKYDVVARHHLIYDVANADRFRSWVVMTIEKNRNGVDKVDLEFRKRFDQGRFDTGGGYVAEQLNDERIFVE